MGHLVSVLVDDNGGSWACWALRCRALAWRRGIATASPGGIRAFAEISTRDRTAVKLGGQMR